MNIRNNSVFFLSSVTCFFLLLPTIVNIDVTLGAWSLFMPIYVSIIIIITLVELFKNNNYKIKNIDIIYGGLILLKMVSYFKCNEQYGNYHIILNDVFMFITYMCFRIFFSSTIHNRKDEKILLLSLLFIAGIFIIIIFLIRR